MSRFVSWLNTSRTGLIERRTLDQLALELEQLLERLLRRLLR